MAGWGLVLVFLAVALNGDRIDMDRWEPIGDDVRAAIVQRLIDDWSRDPDLTPEKVRQLAMWAAASVRALLHELGTLRDLANEGDLMPEAEALMLDGPAEKSEGNSPKSEGNSPPWREGQAACVDDRDGARHGLAVGLVGRRFVDLRTIQRRMAGLDARRQAEQRRRMTGLVTPTHELPSPEVIEKVILGGDLSQLTPKQRASYYAAVCDSLGLNPLTKPFEFLRLSGREVLYALRNCTDQLRKRYDISVVITAREVMEDVYVVTARASLPNGRADESIGAVPIAGLKGESRSNAMMKAETKAKRRVTLSLVGLSTLDESEVESIPHAVKIPDPPVLASVDARDPAAAVGAAAAPADLNAGLPPSWQPFASAQVSGVIVAVEAGKRSGATYVKLDTGAIAGTTDPDTAAQAQQLKASGERVVMTTQPHKKLIHEIVAVVPDDVAF